MPSFPSKQKQNQFASLDAPGGGSSTANDEFKNPKDEAAQHLAPTLLSAAGAETSVEVNPAASPVQKEKMMLFATSTATPSSSSSSSSTSSIMSGTTNASFLCNKNILKK